MNTSDKITACRSNIERLEKAGSSVNTRLSAHIRELCRCMTDSFPKTPVAEDADAFRHEYEAMMETCKISQKGRIEFCRHLPKETGHTIPFSLTRKLLETEPGKGNCTVSYVKNALSDIAYTCFSKGFKRTTVSYAADFVSAIEDVYYSKTDYAILPIASSTLGRMTRFAELIEKYEMKIVMSCNVHSNTDDTDTTFVLLSKSTEILFSPADKSIYLEFVLNDPANMLSKVIQAADSYNAVCYKIHTGENNAVLTFDVTDANVDALCLYIFLEVPRHIPLGIYRALDQ